MNDSDFSSNYGIEDGAVASPMKKFPLLKFSLLKKLDTDGSTCYAYEMTRNSRKYFVKRLRPKFISNPQYVNAFKKEYELGSRLSHPSLPRYVDFQLTSKECYIIMEFVAGCTLEKFVFERRTILNLDMRRKILRQLVDVLDYLHTNNILHYDLLSTNVMITEGLNNVVLIDLDKAFHQSFVGSEGDVSRFEVTEGREKTADADFSALARIVKRCMDSHDLTTFCEMCKRPGVTAQNLYDSLDYKYDGFGKLIPLNYNGLSCDAYVGEWQLQKVYIKKLKPELIDNLYYVEAMKKEYENWYPDIHPDLVNYRNFKHTEKECMIIMEYIEGETLSNMIARKDSWLNEWHEVKEMLFKVMDILGELWMSGYDYLDISADNFYFSPGNHFVTLAILDRVLDVRRVERGKKIRIPNTKPGSYELDFHGVDCCMPYMCRILNDLREGGVDVSWLNEFYLCCNIGANDFYELWRILDRSAKEE